MPPSSNVGSPGSNPGSGTHNPPAPGARPTPDGAQAVLNDQPIAPNDGLIFVNGEWVTPLTAPEEPRILQPWEAAAAAALAAELGAPRRCRICGCLESAPCSSNNPLIKTCWWVPGTSGPDGLCSACTSSHAVPSAWVHPDLAVTDHLYVMEIVELLHSLAFVHQRPDPSCPTCGGAVRVVSTDEGTSHFEPSSPAEVTEHRFYVAHCAACGETADGDGDEYGTTPAAAIRYVLDVHEWVRDDYGRLLCADHRTTSGSAS